MITKEDIVRFINERSTAFEKPNIGSAIGLIVGLVLCAAINCCVSGCSHKSVVIDTESHTDVVSSMTDVKRDSIGVSEQTDVMHKMMSETESWWNAVWTKRTFAYDSTGEQMVVSEEVADIKGGKQEKVVVHDTIYSVSTITIVKDDSVNNNISIEEDNRYSSASIDMPWYYKGALAVVILGVCAVVLRCVIKSRYG